MSNSLPLSRRAFLAAGAVIATSLIAAPHLALATQASIQAAETTVLVDPSLSATELDRALDSKTHAEGDELIRSLMSLDAENASTLSSRPTYDNVYESPQYKDSGYRTVSGQPSGGVMIAGGGSIYIIPNSGGTRRVSFTFSAPWGTVSVACPLGQRASTVTAYSVNIPAGVYCLAQQSVKYKCTPYTTYRTVNGVRSVYSRQVGTQVHSYAFRYIRA